MRGRRCRHNLGSALGDDHDVPVALADRDPAQGRRGVDDKLDPFPRFDHLPGLAEADVLELCVGRVELGELIAGDRRQILGEDPLS